MGKAKTILINQSSSDTILHSTKSRHIQVKKSLNHIESTSSVIKSSTLSEALGLCACVELLHSGIKYSAIDITINIQKSLLLDPENLQARIFLESFPSGC